MKVPGMKVPGMNLDKNVLTFVVILVGGYSLYTQPLGTALSGIGLASIVFALTQSLEAVILVLLATLYIKSINRLITPKVDPVGVEAFQARDPVSVQARLEQVKVASPKIASITGVLESPNILNNTPLQAIDELANEGVPGASIPASSNGRGLIYPPAEGTIPAPSGSIHKNPVANPYLHNGHDSVGIEVSLSPKGTDMVAVEVLPNEMAGVSIGAGPAF